MHAIYLSILFIYDISSIISYDIFSMIISLRSYHMIILICTCYICLSVYSLHIHHRHDIYSVFNANIYTYIFKQIIVLLSESCGNGCTWTQTWGGNQWAPATGYCDCWSGRGGGGTRASSRNSGNNGSGVISNCYGGSTCDMSGCTENCKCYGGGKSYCSVHIIHKSLFIF